MANHKNHLGQSYKLDSVADTQTYYSDWAATYDAEIIANGYATPQRCADALASVTTNKNLNVLDIGCGTGISGRILNEVGFTSIDGCDITSEMLKIADTRQIYKELWLSDPENPFPFDNGKYDAITAVGVIGAGAAPLIVFHQAISKLESGGLFVFSFNDHTLEEPNYEAAVNQEIKNNSFELIFKEYGPHLPGRKIQSNVYILRKI
ncbi:MAG: methyltransferase domain-containing protein [Cocleimonas sp.]